MKKALIMAKITKLLSLSFLLIGRLAAATYSTNFTDGSILAYQTISGAGNTIQHQAKMDNGFGFADSTTSFSFNSYYPVGGSISLNGGKLTLNRDMDTQNTMLVGSAGH